MCRLHSVLCCACCTATLYTKSAAKLHSRQHCVCPGHDRLRLHQQHSCECWSANSHPAAFSCRVNDTSEVLYPYVVNGVPILQQYYASKYVGVAQLAFDAAGALTDVSGDSVPLGMYFVDGQAVTGAAESHAHRCRVTALHRCSASFRWSALTRERTTHACLTGERAVTDAYVAAALIDTADAACALAVAEDAAVVEVLAGRFQQVVDFSSVVVGSLPVSLSAARPDIRIKEMPLGDIICDAMLDALAATVRALPAPHVPSCHAHRRQRHLVQVSIACIAFWAPGSVCLPQSPRLSCDCNYTNET